MIVDVTLTSQPDTRELQVGIRWRSGASEQHAVQRPPKPADAKRTAIGGDRADQATRRRPHQHADRRAAQRRRDAHQHRAAVRREGHQVAALAIPDRPQPAAYERADRQPDRGAARHLRRHRLRVDPTGKLAARRGPANRLYIAYGPDVEQHCRQLISELHSPTTPNQNQGCRRCSLMPPSPP